MYFLFYIGRILRFTQKYIHLLAITYFHFKFSLSNQIEDILAIHLYAMNRWFIIIYSNNILLLELFICLKKNWIVEQFLIRSIFFLFCRNDI